MSVANSDLNLAALPECAETETTAKIGDYFLQRGEVALGDDEFVVNVFAADADTDDTKESYLPEAKEFMRAFTR